MYPVLDLRCFEQDLHWYMRMLEEVVIEALGALGLRGERVAGLTGVWVGGRKVAAVGVRARRWVTYHGLALNVTTDLAPFDHIVPCGIHSRGVTSVKDLLLAQRALREQEDMLDDAALLERAAQALLESFASIFDVRFQVNV